MAKKTVPNLYALSGDGIGVTYSTTSIAGKPQLTYNKGRRTFSFSGAQIASLDVGIGTLVTVVLEKIADKGSTSFSVLLPAIQMADSRNVSFRTIGITTVASTTIAGPVKGAQQTYKTIALRGSAQLVDF